VSEGEHTAPARGGRAPRARRRHPRLRVALVALVVGSLSAIATVAAGAIGLDTAGAVRPWAGLLPPANPPANIAASSADPVQATDQARADEGVPPLVGDQGAFDALSTTEQIFVVENLERTARGLPPFSAMTAQLDADAQVAAASASDPSFPRSVTGGGPVLAGGGIWAGGWSSALAANYEWMYQDGWGGTPFATLNVNCTSPFAGGCWGHRDVILHDYSGCTPAGTEPTLVMGAGADPTAFPGGSLAAVFICTDAVPSDEVFTWTQAEQMLGIEPGVVGMAAAPGGAGYWEVSSDGTVRAFGSATSFGDMSGKALNAPIAGMAATPDGGGYWLVASDGGIFSFGDARFHGSTGAIHLNKPIVGMTATPDGRGYWFVASDGGVFAFGDAPFYGSMGATRLDDPVVAMAADEATGGYWLVASDGGVFAFGAPFYGSTGGIPLNRPIVAMEVAPDGSGYRFAASDGGVFAFNLPFEGSMGGVALAQPVTGMAATGATGYWLVAGDGGLFSFGGAGFFGAPG